MPPRLTALALAAWLISACTAGPTTTSVGVSTATTVAPNTTARVGASTAGRGVHLGLGLGHLIR